MRKVIFAIAAVAALASCGGQKTMSPEERLKAFNEADSLMMVEYQTAMDSLAGDREKFMAFYEEFVQRYIDFNLEAAAQNPDSQVAVQVLKNLMGLIDDEQVSGIIDNMSEELLQDEVVAYMKTGLDARKATAEGMMFTDFTVEHVYGYDRSVEPQPLKKEVKFSDYVGKGTYVLVDFWSPWCGPCKREIPNIKTVYEQYKDQGLEVLSLAVWERQPQSHTIETAGELGMDWLHINNCGKVPTDIYGVEGIPHLMLIGPDGTILKRGFHGLEGIQAAVAEFIQ
ncbi:MAG: TlpA family protein disulfide reductase [Bacteroidales bacterium]|nr:TlpA family protein disulfide reductase [Bacteroidales bacterium]